MSVNSYDLYHTRSLPSEEDRAVQGTVARLVVVQLGRLTDAGIMSTATDRIRL